MRRARRSRRAARRSSWPSPGATTSSCRPRRARPSRSRSEGWSATRDRRSRRPMAGDLRIDLAIQNGTGDWSEMSAAADKPAVLTGGDGATTDCADRHGRDRRPPAGAGLPDARLHRWHEARAGTGADPASSVPARRPTPGSRLTIDYRYATGEYDYYDTDATETSASLEVDLDEVASRSHVSGRRTRRRPDPARPTSRSRPSTTSC